MKKRDIFLFGIILILTTSFVFAVVNFFHSQVPADLSTTNALQGALNITFNISDPASLDRSTIRIFYKVNSSTSDTGFFHTNGSLTSGYHNRNYTDNTSDTFTFRLFHDQVYPATYNYNETIMQGAAHSTYDLDEDDEVVKIRFFNVSNLKNYSFFEVWADNQSAVSLSLRLYYCNSSYTSNANVFTSPLCTNFYNMLSSEAFNHTHQVSKHHVIPFPINATSGQIGGVYVTETSYFILRGRTSATDAWNVFYITNVARADTIQINTNVDGGGAWTNLAGTVDAHFHQYDGTDTFWYYSCADGSTAPTQNCTTPRQDLIDLSGLPPNAPGITSPTNQSYNENITIEYTAAASPNAYPIIVYNITLLNQSDDRISVINANNSVNLSYVWNTIGTPDGTYNIHVSGYDSNYLFSTGESDDFTIDNTDPSGTFSCTPSSLNIGESITCTCTSSDALSGVATTVFTEHPSTGNAGTFITTCTITDVAGNSLVKNFSYTVSYGGAVDGGGGGGGGGSSGGTTTPTQPTEPTTPPAEEIPSVEETEFVDVVVEDETHTLEILEVGSESVRTIFSYDGSEQNFVVGEEKIFNIGEYIITVKLERIENGMAVFNVLAERKPLFELTPQLFAIIVGAVVVIVLAILIFLRKAIKHKRKIVKPKKNFFKKLFSKIFPKSQPYVSETTRKQISAKIQTAKRLRERARELVEEARQKRKHAFRSEAIRKLKESYRYREKSRKLLKEARGICKNCKVRYRKFK